MVKVCKSAFIACQWYENGGISTFWAQKVALKKLKCFFFFWNALKMFYYLLFKSHKIL